MMRSFHRSGGVAFCAFCFVGEYLSVEWPFTNGASALPEWNSRCCYTAMEHYFQRWNAASSTTWSSPIRRCWDAMLRGISELPKRRNTLARSLELLRFASVIAWHGCNWTTAHKKPIRSYLILWRLPPAWMADAWCRTTSRCEHLLVRMQGHESPLTCHAKKKHNIMIIPINMVLWRKILFRPNGTHLQFPHLRKPHRPRSRLGRRPSRQRRRGGTLQSASPHRINKTPGWTLES